MADDPSNLRPASRDEISDALAHALRYDGRKRWRQADDLQARIAADHLLRCLEMSGFVLLRKPPTRMHSWSDLGMQPPSPYPLKD